MNPTDLASTRRQAVRSAASPPRDRTRAPLLLVLIPALPLAALLTLLCCTAAKAAAGVDWPDPAVPKGVELFDLGGEMVSNGLPLRMRGILSALPPQQVAALFRASLGRPLVETPRGAKLVLGRPLGEFYLTVQLEPAGAGTRGVIAMTRPRTAIQERAAIAEAGRRVLARFPAGSKLLGRTDSNAGTQRAESLALSNSLDTGFNVEHLKRMLDAEGYTLERAAASVRTARNGTTLFFKRRDGDAVAVIYPADSGGTAIVLNTVTRVEPHP